MTSANEHTFEELKAKTTPFDNIGLAFSGGGFRAASFSLGVLSYFNTLVFDEAPLLQNVTYISSASGGTIANAMYAVNSAEGNDFEEFYKKLFENLEGERLLKKVFEILNTDDAWKKTGHKQRNFINAFALAYDDLLFNHKPVSNLKNTNPKSKLEEVCFNATDFYRGLLFRQQIKLKPDKEERGFLFGNFIINIKEPAIDKLKIADLLAASSCFPAGFEPIIFPLDFANESISADDLLSHLCIAPQEVDWEELNLLYHKKDVDRIIAGLPKPINADEIAKKVKGLPINKNFSAGLMDGGITDNQGIESLMRANDRRKKCDTNFKEFDLMLVNDVGSHFMAPYIPEIECKSYTGLAGITLNTVRTTSALIALVGLAALLYSFISSNDLLLIKITAVLGSVLLVLFGGIFFGIELVKKFIRGKVRSGTGLNLDKTFSPQIVKSLIHQFGSTPIAVLGIMLRDRVSSVLTLNGDVFLKRIRQLLYQRFLGEGRRSFRMKTNHVYDLSFSNDLNRRRHDVDSLHPGNNLQVVAQAAFEMGTTLWFDTESQKDGSLAALIACGQFTTCYNLLLYIHRMKEIKDGVSYFSTLPVEYQEKINRLQQELDNDYSAFKTDPFFLYNELGVLYKISGFKPQTMEQFPFPPKGFEKLRG